MTAIPLPQSHPAGSSARRTLVCDGCGHAITHHDGPVGGWPQQWAQACRAGWCGRDWSFGPHYCPACAEHRATRPDLGTRAGERRNR